MSKLITISIDLMKIDKSKIKEFTRKDGTKGKSVDLILFVNEEIDKFGNNVSVALSKQKDSNDPTIYIGNGKDRSIESPKLEVKKPTLNSQEDDLPF
jgi:hypothetical protein